MKAAAVLLALSWPVGAGAQTASPPPQPRAEIFGGWAVVPSTSGGTLEATYAPPLRLGGTPIESRSTQTLAVDSSPGQGFEVGTNLYFSRVLGVQASFAWSRADVSGANQDYDVYLRYIAMQPPDYVPREYTYERSSPWADTTGSLRRTSLAFGGVVRWRAAPGKVGGTLSGGVNVDGYSGTVESVAYTQFILGGHATLFPVRHRVAMAPADGQRVWGPYVAGDVHLQVTRRLALYAGVRVTFGSRPVVPAVAERLVDPTEDPWTPELTDVKERLDGQPLDLPGTHWRLAVGVKVPVG